MRLHWKAKVKELNAEYAELLARKKAAYDDEGNADPSMITFVYKTGFEDKKKGDDYKPPRRNSKSKTVNRQLKSWNDKWFLKDNSSHRAATRASNVPAFLL